MEHYDVLIIGGGPAAITIAKMTGHLMKTGMIRPEDHSMIYCAMPYAIEKILPFEKTLKKDQIVEETGTGLIRDSVSHVDFSAKEVTCESGRKISYQKLVIATGAVPIIPPVPGADLRGVMTFKTEDDLRKLISISEKGLSKAVVIGAGAIGIELAQAFNHVGVETHLVDMAERVLPSMLDPDMGSEVEEELIRLGINLHLRSGLVKIEGNEYAASVILNDGKKIILDSLDNCSAGRDEPEVKGIVVFAVGMRPETELVAGSGIMTGKEGIIVDEYMRTSISDVYAVGDCVQFRSGITGETVPGRLATNAVPMGRVCARNILGEADGYQGFFNGAATKIGEFFAGSTGIGEHTAKGSFELVTGTAELTTIFPNMPDTKKVRMKLTADRKTMKILGAQIVSGMPVTDKLDIITLAIQNGLTVPQIRNLSYSSQPYQSYYPANNLIVAAADDIMKKLHKERIAG
ncbi:MAG TPA: FAD-dependent oxidoreductase [Spirochaetota bacterium]|nr:FAD-dependent oxidoreductase [Spirochaetota bacterium]